MSFLAALVGVFWNPTLLAAKALLDARSVQKQEVAAVTEEAKEIVQAASSGGQAKPVSEVDFSNFLEKYSSTWNGTYFPDYKNKLEEDASIRGLIEEASKQPWFGQEYKDITSQYPNIESWGSLKPQ